MTELQIRNAIISTLMQSSTWSNSTFIPEMFVDEFARRADLVVAGSKLVAFEIKSDRDRLDRLEGQLLSYTRFFEQVTVVCAERHFDGIEALSADDIGIWIIKDDGAIRKIRNAKTLANGSVESWLSFLPVDELKALLRANGLRVNGRRQELVAAAAELSIKKIRSYVLSYLKRRDQRIRARVAKKGLHTSIAAPIPSLDQYFETLGDAPLKAIPRLRVHSSKPSSSSCPD